MTDRKPDDLFDALRDRLADYGQKPPAPLWASIRAQLPPPVAAPQLRRRRRWAPVALLVLLFAAMSGAGWQWWYAQQRPATAASAGRQVKSGPHSPANSSANKERNGALAAATAGAFAKTRASVAAGGPASRPATGSVSAADAATGTAASAATAVGSVPGNVASAASASVGLTVDYSDSRDSKRLHSAGSLQSSNMPIVGISSHPRGVAGTTGRVGFAASVSGSSSAAALGSRRNTRHSRAFGAGSWVAARPAARRAGLASRQLGNKPAAYSAKTNADGTESAAAIAAQQPPASSPERLGEDSPASTGSVTLAARAEASSLQPSVPSSAQGRTAAEAGLLAHRAALQPAVWPAPTAPQLVAVEPSPRPKPLGGRWAVQALVGPALTYRHLGAAPTATNSGPTTRPTAAYAGIAATTPVAGLERPALGAGAQLSLRRALGPHWAVSTGLGYTEYATRLALQQVPTSADTTIRFVPQTPPKTLITRINSRDIYRFVTVPLRLSYTWTLTGRWRVGALAGADAALYVGGSSTEGSACACQAQNWGASGSPYRRFSLGASLGAEVRYRLTDRWELLAQPTASYLLSPLASASAGYYARHLFGGTALLGVSFDLP